MNEYIITCTGEIPPQIIIGQELKGAKVVKIELNEKKAISASELSEIYPISVETIRKKLSGYNIGSCGKFMYPVDIAHRILSQKDAQKVGRKRAIIPAPF